MQQKGKGRSGEASRLRDKLLLFNARTRLSQQDLARFVGVSTAALRNWEAGQSKPTPQNLRRLIEIYVTYRAFAPGEEYTEAAELWESAQERGLKVPFDEKWFQELLLNRQESNSEAEREHANEEQRELAQEPELEHGQERLQRSETGVRDARPGTENESVLLSQDHRTLPSSSTHTLSRRSIVVGLTCLVLGGAVGSSVTWAALHSQTKPPPRAQWRQTGNMLLARSFFRATPLKNGHILIEGGVTSEKSTTAQSELFDPTTGTWRRTKGMLNEARAKQSAVLLPSGKVLVAGGFGTLTTSSAELYDPATETWALTKETMNQARARHTATMLQTGKVLIAGGVHDNTSELYDPATDTWSLSGNMLTPRSDHVAVLLLDGRVLVAGGTNRNDERSVTGSAEVYDPTTHTWSSVQSMHLARADFTAVLLPDGRVLVIGGRLANDDVTPTTEIYDPFRGSWLLGASMNYARQNPLGQEAVRFEDGTILVVGGDTRGTSEIYSPTTGTWISSLTLTSPHYLGATASLGKGQVVVAGGFNVLSSDDKRKIIASAEVYVPGLE